MSYCNYKIAVGVNVVNMTVFPSDALHMCFSAGHLTQLLLFFSSIKFTADY